MKKIGEMGWGMVILSHTYSQLGLALRNGVRGYYWMFDSLGGTLLPLLSHFVCINI